MFNYIILYYYNMNIIWENKGIILGIISYLIENHEQLKYDKIIIKNTKFNTIITNLFPDMKIMDNGSGFKINIKNQKNNGLIINNLQNLSVINAKKVTILPWFDKDNAIIMYLYDKKEIYDKNFLKTEIKILNENDRFKPRQSNNFQYVEFIQKHCELNIWDTYTEYDILLSYIRYYPNNIFKLNQYIDNELGGLYCNKPLFITIPTILKHETSQNIINDKELHSNSFFSQAMPVPSQNSINYSISTIPKHKTSLNIPDYMIKSPINKSFQYDNLDKLIDNFLYIISHVNKVLEFKFINT